MPVLRETCEVVADGAAEGGEGPLVVGDLGGIDEVDTGDFAGFGGHGVEGIDGGGEVGVDDGVDDGLVVVVVGEGGEEGEGGEFEADLFLDLAGDGFFEAFAGVGEASGDAVLALGWFLGAFDDEQLAGLVEDEGAGGAGGVEEEGEAAGAA